MDLHDYIGTMRRRWRFVAVCVLLGLAGAIAVTALMPRTYTATAQLFVATSDEDSGNAYQGGLFTQQRVKSYTRIVTSPAVLDGVITELGLDTTPGRLAQRIEAQAPLDTTLVDIRVSDGSAQRAQAIADQTALQFTKYIAAIEGSASNAPPLVKASVVGGSEPPTTPTSPRPALNLGIGLLLGLAAGFCGAVLRQQWDTTVRSTRDIADLDPLAAVPAPVRGRPDPTERTEALARLRTGLRFGTEGGLPATVLVTSALPEEGRTRTALDLATSVARTGRRVVLVEADLRRPRLAADLALGDGPGLSGVLARGVPLYQALRTWDGIRVLPAGPVPADPGTLLSSQDLPRLLRALGSDADLVVLDSPPLLPFGDAAVLAPATEGTLLVIRAGRTRRGDADRALDALAAVRARVLGTVLTGARPEDRADWRPPRHEEPARPAEPGGPGDREQAVTSA
ncbi:Wzz/FepE/Etk N-terminal domain-containing protein [Streptomyces sp. NPDC090106]|uniref:Wzz/FepE/Etk N-terminal domain-containing protein n=1 Tax=Streptomyces sp. NPDC090106 TaxID=3365946 RepID=UPI00381B97D7